MRKLASFALIIGALSFVTNGVMWAATSPAAEAVEHTKEAIEHGKARTCRCADQTRRSSLEGS